MTGLTATAPRRSGRLDTGPSRAAALRTAAYRVSQVVLFAVLPVIFAAAFAYWQHDEGIFGFDFEGTVYAPAEALIAGESPYPAPTDEAVDVGNPSVYPPTAIMLGVPFTVLPYAAAELAWAALLAAGFALALLVLGVRDWRLYGLAFASFPVLHAVTFGNFTLLLLPLLALAWRYRDRAWVVAAAVAAMVATKLILWPLFVWLVATRRFRAALGAAAASVAWLLAGWALVGFDELRVYPRLLGVLTDLYAPNSNSFFSAGVALGLTPDVSKALSGLVGLALLAAALYLGWRRRDDFSSFSLVLAATLLLTPMVWPHYFALLLVPLAIFRKRLSGAWLVLLGGWCVTLFLPRPELRGDCCGGELNVPEQIWEPLHVGPALWPTLGYNVVALVVVAVLVAKARRVAEPGRPAGRLQPRA